MTYANTLQTVFVNDPFRHLYNLDGFESYAMTADIDWAPEFAIEDMLSLFYSADIKITCFATHPSPALSRGSSLIEVGLHPDYTRPDAQRGLAGQLDKLQEIFPESKGVRSHRNFFGQNVAQLAAERGFLYDSSVLLWRQPLCQIHKDQWGLFRLCYSWEDGIQADMRLPWSLDVVPIDSPGLKIFNVHPIFIYLNCPDDNYRRAVVKDYPNLTLAPHDILRGLRFDGYGARRFLTDLLSKLKETRATAYHLKEMVMSASLSA